MKQLSFIIIIFFICFSARGDTFTSVTSGDWSSLSTWDLGSVPGASDDVIIAASHTVTVTTVCSVSSIDVLASDNDNIGILEINTGANLSTTSHTVIYGKLNIVDGTFNAGNSSGDKLTINGSFIGGDCEINITGGTLNISRYFALSNGSAFVMSGGVINVNTEGGSSSTDIFNIPSATSFTMSNGSINILNGNLGSGEALKLNPSVSSVTGGTINFTNTLGYNQTTIVMDIDLNNIICDVGTGNVLTIDNMPASTTGFSCNDLTVSTGSARINVGSGLTVNGTMSNNTGLDNGLVVSSDNSGNASLIVSGSTSGNVSVERYIEQYSGSDDGWHLISSPVNNMLIENSDFEPGDDDDLFSWDESQNTWLNYKVPSNSITHLTNGSGYIAAYLATDTRSFTGTLNTSDITQTNLSIGLGNGWHLLGNPFPSSITWGTSDWNLSNIGGVAKVWDESSGNYTDISANNQIPSTNGFFIQAASSSNSITIPLSARTHNLGLDNYKSLPITMNETLIINITASHNNFSDKALVGFKFDATTDWDVLYDSRKLFGNDLAPQLYTVIDNEHLSTSYLPYVYKDVGVPLNFEARSSGTFYLIFENLDSFYENTKIFLEDQLVGNQINIRDDSIYMFNAHLSDPSDRFILYFSNVTNTSEYNLAEFPVIYFSNTKIKVKNHIFRSNDRIQLYNLLGQEMVIGYIDHNGLDITGTNLVPGIYFIELKSDKYNICQKLIINPEY